MIKFFQWERAWRKKTVWFSLMVILIFITVALLAPWIAPHEPYEWSLTQSSLPPMWVQGLSISGSAEYPLGTDWAGRDILSRLIYGTRTAVFLAFAAVPLAALIGTTVGLVAGYRGGRFDSFVMLFSDMIHSLPGIMFMVIIILIFRNKLSPSWSHGIITLVIGFAAVSWVSLARLIRINAMSIKTQLFVEAAISLGASPMRVITRHLLPNVLHVILAWVLINIPAVILLEAILGYVGIQVTRASDGGEFTVLSWGGMFYAGRVGMSHNPLMLIIPSVSIFLLCMSFFLLGDFINEATRQE